MSLGRGAMLEGSTLLELQGLPPKITAEEENQFTVADPAFPSAVAIDLVPGADAAPLAARIADAGPGGDPGGTYRQPRVLGAAIVNAAQMGSQPLVLALALAAAAVLSLAVAILASVRQRRAELALLKALGLTRRQVREVIALAGQRDTRDRLRGRGAARGRGRPLGVGQSSPRSLGSSSSDRDTRDLAASRVRRLMPV